MADAVVFDFNGTLSDDEPLLARVYQEQFAELGRPISEAEYYEHLAGHTDEEMFTRWFGHADQALIEDRIARYNLLAADGLTVDGVDATRMLVFEDTDVGVAAAKAAGARVVGLTRTLGADRMANADELVERIDLPLMERLLCS
jgi:beta-phosphoglucomutase